MCTVSRPKERRDIQLFSDFKFLNKIEFKIGLEQIWDFLNCKEKIYFILNWEDEERFRFQNKIIK